MANRIEIESTKDYFNKEIKNGDIVLVRVVPGEYNRLLGDPKHCVEFHEAEVLSIFEEDGCAILHVDVKLEDFGETRDGYVTLYVDVEVNPLNVIRKCDFYKNWREDGVDAGDYFYNEEWVFKHGDVKIG